MFVTLMSIAIIHEHRDCAVTMKHGLCPLGAATQKALSGPNSTQQHINSGGRAECFLNLVLDEGTLSATRSDRCTPFPIG